MEPVHPAIQALQQWWPALLLAFIAYQGLKFITKRSRSTPKLNDISYDIHQIRTTLACSELQARNLLSTYNGNAARAIHEVKTGKVVLPGAELESVARFQGEAKSFLLEPSRFGVLCRDGSETLLDPTAPALLILGVVDPEGRADNQGLQRADRGTTYGQLFWRDGETWLRFLLDASRMDYFHLGERKQNSAIRNFKIVLEDLAAASSGLKQDTSVAPFLLEFRAPHYAKLADLDAAAVGVARRGS